VSLAKPLSWDYWSAKAALSQWRLLITQYLFPFATEFLPVVSPCDVSTNRQNRRALLLSCWVVSACFVNVDRQGHNKSFGNYPNEIPETLLCAKYRLCFNNSKTTTKIGLFKYIIPQFVTWLRFVKIGFVWGTGEGFGAGLC